MKPQDQLAGGNLIAAQEGLGGLTVLIFVVVSTFERFWATLSSPSLVVFGIMALQPLIALTWRWHFFRFSEQEVNVQTLTSLLLLCINLALVLHKRNERPKLIQLNVLLTVATISVITTPTTWGVNELIRLFAGAMLFYTAGWIFVNEANFVRFIRIVLFSITVPIIFAFLEIAHVLSYQYWDWIDGNEVGRATGSYDHPLVLIYFLVYAIPLSLALKERPATTQLERALIGFFLCGAALALIFTFHRVGLVTCACELLAWLFLTGRRKASLLIVAAAVVAFSMYSDWLQIFFSVGGVDYGNVDWTTGEFMRGRGLNWFLYLQSFSSGSPFHWVVGKGGSVPSGFENLFSNLSPNEAHNDFIRLLHAYGLLGFLFYLWILSKFFRVGGELSARAAWLPRSVGNVLVISSGAIALLSLTSEPSRYPGAIFYLFALGGGACLLFRREGKRRDFGKQRFAAGTSSDPVLAD